MKMIRGEGFFVQIEKQGRILRRTKNRKNLKKPVIKVLKKQGIISTGGGTIFLAGQKIYPCSILKKEIVDLPLDLEPCRARHPAIRPACPHSKGGGGNLRHVF